MLEVLWAINEKNDCRFIAIQQEVESDSSAEFEQDLFKDHGPHVQNTVQLSY